MKLPLVLAAASGLGACGSGGVHVDVRYRMVGRAAAVGGACADGADPAPPDIVGATRVRLTYMDAGTNQLRCDAVIGLDETGTVIGVPGADEPVDLVVEYLDDAGEVLARGGASAIDLRGTPEVEVPIVPSAQFACAPDVAAAGRAFHSATRLPTGEVLLIGGIAGPNGDAAIDPTAGFFLQPRAEIYDPADGRVRVATIPSLVPRAFHQAYVIGDNGGTIDIAVLGGLTVTGDPASTPVAVVGTRYRLEAAPNAVGAAGQLLHYDPANSTFTVDALDASVDVTPRAFGTLSPPGDLELAYVGGENPANTAALPRTDVDRIDGATGERSVTIATRRPRIGSTVTAFAPGTLLVWGGDAQGGVAADNPEVGELLTTWGGTPGTAAITFDAASPDMGPHRGFHAAAFAGDGSVIVVGGYRMNDDSVTAQVNSVLQRLENPMSGTIATTLLDATLATPVGFPAAAALAGGDVLAAGGNPDPVAAGCVPDAAGLVCASAQAVRYRVAGGIGEVTGPMGVPRYGIALTALTDGTVLASGGLTVRSDALVAAADLEVYEPRGTADDPLAPDHPRDPGDIARTAAGDPLAPCDIVIGPADAGP